MVPQQDIGIEVYRHRHSGILHFSPIPEHSGTGLVPALAFLLIPVPD
jgi:hypothetical protein